MPTVVFEQQAASGLQGAVPLELEQAVQQVGHVAQVVEEVAHAGAQEARGHVFVAVDHGQEHPLVEAVVEVVHATVPRFERVIHVEGVDGRAFKLALVQTRVEFEFA